MIRFVHAGRHVPATAYGVGALTPDQPLRPTRGSVEFTTPSGNISCAILGTDPEVLCDVAHYSFAAPPRPASCTLNYGPGWVSLTGAGVTQALCLGGPPIYPVSHTLAYGSALVAGRLACRSDTAFLACADTGTGHGFVVSRTRLQTY